MGATSITGSGNGATDAISRAINVQGEINLLKKRSTGGSVIIQGPDPWFDVKAYGAKGDGVTNDQAAVQTTINTAVSFGGGIVYFPTGTYILESPPGSATAINIPSSNIALRGNGPSSILYNNTIVSSGPAAGDGQGVVAISATSNFTNIEISDLTMQNNGTVYVPFNSGLGLIYITPPYANTIDNLRIHDCTFITKNRVAISFGGNVTDFHIYNNTIIGQGETGIYLAGFCTRGIVDHNFVLGTFPTTAGAVGISIRQCTDVDISNNYVSGYNLYGMIIRDNTNINVSIRNNTVVNCNAVGAVGIGANVGQKIVIENNVVDNCYFGVYVTAVGAVGGNPNDYVVKGNTIRNTTGSYGIDFVRSGSNYPNNFIITDNVLHNCFEGIQADGVMGLAKIANNTVYRDSLSANPGINIIELTPQSNVFLENNDVLNYSGNVVDANVFVNSNNNIFNTIPTIWIKADGTNWQDTAMTVPAVADGDPVAVSADASGNNNNVIQAVLAKRATLKLAIQNGKPVLRFDGVNSFLQRAAFGTALLAPFTVFVVFKDSSGSGLAVIADGSAGNNQFLKFGANWDWSAVADTNLGPADSNWHTAYFEINGASSKYRFDGGVETLFNTAPLSGSMVGLALGGRYDGGNLSASDIGEVQVYGGLLLSSVKSSIMNMLRSRWATW